MNTRFKKKDKVFQLPSLDIARIVWNCGFAICDNGDSVNEWQ